tara:strand:+ start:269 stop:874 length:606 start_codon:yes stop_codon:yes gene_type:complete
MNSITPLPNDFIKKHCKPNFDKTPEYGIRTMPVSYMTTDFLKDEINNLKIAEKANVSSGESGIRKVMLWRIPVHSKVGDLFTKWTLELNNSFNYNLSSIQDIQYLEYKVGDYYDWHCDIGDGLASMRKISMSLVLNENEYDGGELEFFHGGQTHVIANRVSDEISGSQVVAFTSFYNHRVRIVTKGIRKSIVVWVNGESWR